jgi:hypothetical protein
MSGSLVSSAAQWHRFFLDGFSADWFFTQVSREKLFVIGYSGEASRAEAIGILRAQSRERFRLKF